MQPCSASPAIPPKADSYFMPADDGRETRSGVIALHRGALTHGVNSSTCDTGEELHVSYTDALPLCDLAVMKFGPTISKAWQDDAATDGDLRSVDKISIERLRATKFGGSQGLA